MNKKYVWFQNGSILSYDNSDCYLNEKIIPKEQLSDSKDLAKSKQKAFYESLFKKHFRNVVVLTGAGTSINNGGKTRADLWDIDCKSEIEAINAEIKDLKDEDFYKKKDIEGLLSYITLYEKLNGEIEVEKISLRRKLENKIVTACTLKIKTGDSTHEEFLKKITAIKPSDPRIKLFTLNYDLLFEEAANNSGFTIIDGFSFSYPRTFSGKYFDLDIVNREKTRIKNEESFDSKVFHLYKMHGSLKWHKEGDKIKQTEKPENPLIIYPANDKYESSYEQPYFEMMSRFQQALRKENTLLIVIGFGFGDKHIQNVINEAVDQNSSFHLAIINFKGKDEGMEINDFKQFFINIEKKQIKKNVTIIYDSFEDFVEKYPSNNTYLDQEKQDLEKNNGGSNEAIQS
jgi:NAD-dependent SIR2 family protein deacetylase